MARRTSSVVQKRFITIEGIDAITRDLSRFERQVQSKLFQRWRPTIRAVANTAKRLAPRLTGDLASGIEPVLRENAMGIVTRRPHGRILEYGGRHPLFGDRTRWVSQRAQPHINPAVDRHSDEVVKKALAAVDDAAKAIGF